MWAVASFLLHSIYHLPLWNLSATLSTLPRFLVARHGWKVLCSSIYQSLLFGRKWNMWHCSAFPHTVFNCIAELEWRSYGCSFDLCAFYLHLFQNIFSQTVGKLYLRTLRESAQRTNHRHFKPIHLIYHQAIFLPLFPKGVVTQSFSPPCLKPNLLTELRPQRLSEVGAVLHPCDKHRRYTIWGLIWEPQNLSSWCVVTTL